MDRERYSFETAKKNIIASASRIAGSAWDDRVQIGMLAEQLRRVAYDSDGNLIDDDIRDLVSLAREAEELKL